MRSEATRDAAARAQRLPWCAATCQSHFLAAATAAAVRPRRWPPPTRRQCAGACCLIIFVCMLAATAAHNSISYIDAAGCLMFPSKHLNAQTVGRRGPACMHACMHATLGNSTKRPYCGLCYYCGKMKVGYDYPATWLHHLRPRLRGWGSHCGRVRRLAICRTRTASMPSVAP